MFFGGSERVCNSVLVAKLVFGKVRISVFSRFGLGFGPFLAEQVQSSGFSEGFEWV